MADKGYFVRAFVRWANAHPELVVMLCLILMGCVQVLAGGDPTNIVTGIFGYLTGKAEDKIKNSGDDDENRDP